MHIGDIGQRKLLLALKIDMGTSHPVYLGRRERHLGLLFQGTSLPRVRCVEPPVASGLPETRCFARCKKKVSLVTREIGTTP